LRYGFEGTDLRCGRFSSWPDEASVRFWIFYEMKRNFEVTIMFWWHIRIVGGVTSKFHRGNLLRSRRAVNTVVPVDLPGWAPTQLPAYPHELKIADEFGNGDLPRDASIWKLFQRPMSC
jgi:hypothetical protein